MAKNEFNEVLEKFEIDDTMVILTTEGRYGKSEKVYCWNNFAIWFGGSYYAVIHGKIPLEIARRIYQKYPGNPYGIRINGSKNDLIPNKNAIDDIYDKEIKGYISQHLSTDAFKKKIDEANKNLMKRPKDNKYIKSYDIDTKKGLEIFFTKILFKKDVPKIIRLRAKIKNGTI